MASRTLVVRVDDLTGEQLEPSRGETVPFALDGQAYEIDLSGENATELRQALRRYTTAARRLGASSRRTTSRRSTPQRTDNAAVRAWARDHGHTVPDRGRIPQTVMAAYTAAH